ncbi:MAG TPA: ATP-binding protein [Polyangiales bacterium]|nr:ATP-binding protein [Polyangiales bacterium]
MVPGADSIDRERQMPRPTGFLSRLRARTLEPLWNAMERVATRGDLATRCAPMRGSELSPLRDAFDAMVQRLERRELARERYRRELSAKLAARERELERQRRRTRELLAALDQAVIVVDRAGMPYGERSAAFDRFFGAPEPGQTFAQVMARASASFASELAEGWRRIEDAILPLPLVLSQLPRAMDGYDERSYRFDYHAFTDQDDCTLVVISEITDSVELRAREHDRSQLLGVLERVAADRTGFARFFQESELLLRKLCDGTAGAEADERRALHTLGANLRLFGLEELAELVGTMETRAAQAGLGADERTLLSETFQRFAERARPLLGIEPERSEVDRHTLQRLLAAVRTPETPPALRALAERLSHEAVEPKLRQLAEAASTRAALLGRDAPRVEIEAELVLAPARLHWFWQVLPHVVHNAVEHGHAATLRLRAHERDDVLIVDVEDDGVGIDWNAVRACAERLELPAGTPAQLQSVLFTHGASTVAANDVGRGLGLAAVDAQCRRHGARWELVSTPGQGCRFRFELPLASAHHEERRRAEHR